MKEWIIAFIIVLIIMLPIVYIAYHNDKNIEEYCSVAHQHSVTDYKACRNLTQTELIEKLTKDFNKNNEVPTLEIIK